jgi:hypothetical protein
MPSRLALSLKEWECVMPKTELDGLPVIDADESEEITVAVSADDMQAGDQKNPNAIR